MLVAGAMYTSYQAKINDMASRVYDDRSAGFPYLHPLNFYP
jgi:hypothetical protein